MDANSEESVKKESYHDSSTEESLHNRKTPIISEDKHLLDTSIMSEKIKNDLDLNLEQMDTDILKDSQTNHSQLKQEKAGSSDDQIPETSNQDGVRPLKRYRNRVPRRSKRPKKDTSKVKSSSDEKTDDEVKGNNFYSSCSDDGDDYVLTVSKIPSTWNYNDIKNFIEKECGHYDDLTLLKDQGDHRSIKLTFQDEKDCKNAKDKLQEKVVEGNKLEVTMEVESYTESNIETRSKSSWINSLDLWENDEEGLYGLKPEFLQFLGITPPIDKWVHVTNFRCDKTELRDVMELAGQVLMCSVVTIAKKYAKVMYSHPLEAVQAVSMLNGQILYGSPLKVTIEKNPSDTLTLPKGLSDVGLGLGKRGKPLRNIVQHYERYINNKSSMINPLILSNPLDFNPDSAKHEKSEGQRSLSNLVVNPVNRMAPTVPQNPLIKPQMPEQMNRMPFQNGAMFPAQNPQIGPYPRAQFEGVMARPMLPRVPAVGQCGRGPVVAPVMPPLTPLMMPVMPQKPQRPMSSTVQINNLPISITMPMLCEKLSQSGEVMSLQYSAPGRAVVRFANPPQAERCLHQLNRTQVSGHVLDVRII